MTQKEKEIIAKRYTENTARSIAISDVISERGEYEEYGITYYTIEFYDSYMMEDGVVASELDIVDYCNEYLKMHCDSLVRRYTEEYKNMIDNELS